MKKGFTLVELLGVIIILGVLALIVFPIIDKSIKSSKEKALESTINSIEEAAYNYSIEHNLGYSTNYQKLTLNELMNNGYLKSELINPVTNSKLNGCILYKWDEEYKQYEFTYDEECEVEIILEGTPIIEKAKELIYENGACKTDGTTYQYMDGCYIKGNPNNNYIWYSGFLWRIMGINADGTVRMITDENVTAIPWGKNNVIQSWDGSHAKDWLNNYFYPRLKGNNIIKESTWCSEATADENSARTECTINFSIQSAYVGSLTLDEYNLAGSADSYLNIAQYQWTMTPYKDNNVWRFSSSGSKDNKSNEDTYGIHAVINVKENTMITGGDGTIKSIWDNEKGPYILISNENTNIDGKLNEIVTSGEYVLFADKKYRVVNCDEEGNVKLILDNYYEENETALQISYSENSINIFSTENGIGEKLNNDVLNWLVSINDMENRNKLVTNYSWYQNDFDYGDNYTISLDEENATQTVIATVGLIRIGEMLSGQSNSILTKGYTTAISNDNTEYYWTMTQHSDNNVWTLYYNGPAYYRTISSTYCIRPVIVIKHNVDVVDGNGTWSNPYQI